MRLKKFHIRAADRAANSDTYIYAHTMRRVPANIATQGEKEKYTVNFVAI